MSIKYSIEKIYYNIKYAFQRAIKGYSDLELFSIDHAFTERYLKILKEFRKYNNSYPVNMTEDQWNKIIDRMIELLTYINYFQNNWSVIPSHVDIEFDYNNFNEDMIRFGEIYDKYDKIKYEDGTIRSLSEAVFKEVSNMKKEFFELFVENFDNLWS